VGEDKESKDAPVFRECSTPRLSTLQRSPGREGGREGPGEGGREGGWNGMMKVKTHSRKECVDESVKRK
jgi:hypothetical protein